MKIQVKARVKTNGVFYGEGLPSAARLLWLDAPAITASAKPGQFVMVRCGEGHDPLLRRPLSIHKTDDSGGVAVLYEVVGRGTSWLSERAADDFVDIVGPLGNGFFIRPAAEKLLLVYGGMGVAPLAFLGDMAAVMGKRVKLLPGAQTAALLYPADRLPRISVVDGSTDDGSAGTKGPVTSLIDSYIEQADQVFACGPVSMYKAMAELDCLKGKSVQVSLEERMACGVGACYGCTVKTTKGLKQVCHDGPVFELADIVW